MSYVEKESLEDDRGFEEIKESFEEGEELEWETSDLAISLERVENWGPWEGFREVVQNAMDVYRKGITDEEPEFRCGDVSMVIRDKGDGITLEELRQSGWGTSREDIEAAGEYGTGLKRAVATLTSHGYDVRIYTELCSFRDFRLVEHTDAKGTTGEKILFEYTEDSVIDEGTCFIITKDEEAMEQFEEWLRERFVGLESKGFQSKYVNSEVGASDLGFFVEDREGNLVEDKIFRKGIYVSDASSEETGVGVPTLFSYNITQEMESEEKTGDPFFESDARQSVNENKFRPVLGSIIGLDVLGPLGAKLELKSEEELMQPSTWQVWKFEDYVYAEGLAKQVQIGKEIVDGFSGSALQSEPYYELEEGGPVLASSAKKRAFSFLFRDVNSPDSFIKTDGRAAQKVREAGFGPSIEVPDGWTDFAFDALGDEEEWDEEWEEYKIPFDVYLLGEGSYEIEEFRTLTEEEKDMLEKWLRIITEATGVDVTQYFATLSRHFFEEIDWKMGRDNTTKKEIESWGGFVDGNDVENMYIKAEKLNDKHDLLATLVHEFGHTDVGFEYAPADDSTRRFEKYLQTMLAKLSFYLEDETLEELREKMEV